MLITVLFLVIVLESLYIIRLRRGMAFGDIEVKKTEDGTTFMLHLEGDPAEIANHNRIAFKVILADQ